MTNESTSRVPPLLTLTDDEAVTLRRIAFGESVARSLRQADIARLLQLRLIKDGKDGLDLTVSGKQHFDSLPRALFAGKPGSRDRD